ncbi:uncharacterized protein LOC103314031 [Tribolium castaneum]|uniref:uncharacterized protein LOC103314031 n=1 Tax=Tribolium castaneum TaxID=7070 RepID=UPI0030FDFCFE
MKPPIPIPILQNLRCGHCRKFVTCGPVHVTPDSSILCGRCSHFAKQTYRNIAFEALASIYRYPCTFWPKHCNKRLVWNESLDHETKCLFQNSCNVLCSRPGTFFKSDRKLPNHPDINLEHVPEQMLETLKCVSCESYLTNKPVYLVHDGRNICHRCIHSNGAPKGAVRNLAYETIATSIIFPCVYRFRGCTIWLQFGREMWGHENDCPYGQIRQKLTKNPSRTGKEKERGVIETHSGHIWGTITPHSALFAPPKTKNNEGKIVTQELEEKMKKKKEDENKSLDSQSLDSVMTFDSDNVSRTTPDNTSRSSSRQGVPRSHQIRIPRPSELGEVAPVPTPPGYNRISHNGYFQDNLRSPHVDQYRYLYHFPPVYFDNSNQAAPSPQILPKRSESLRVGHQELIDELKVRQNKKISTTPPPRELNPYQECNNLQEIVQKHDEVFN